VSSGAEPLRHELNRSFHWSRHDGPFRVVSEAQARQYDDDGYFVLEDAIAPDDVAALVAAIDPFEAKVEAALREADGGRVFIARPDEITFSTHLVAESILLRRFTSSSLFADLAADLIEDVTELARRIAKTPPGILRMKKYSINRAAEIQGFRTIPGLGAETDALLHASGEVKEMQGWIRTDGVREAIRRFEEGG